MRRAVLVKDAAHARLAAIAIESGEPFYAVLAFVGALADDGRMFDELTWRDPPLPFLFMPATLEGHDGSYVVGRIDEVTVDGNRVLGKGVYDTTPEAQEAARLAREKMQNGVSVDATGDVWPVIECAEWGADDACMRERVRYPTAVIVAATQVAGPAFAGAEVAFGDYPATELPPADPIPDVPEGAGDNAVLDMLFTAEPCGCGRTAACGCDLAFTGLSDVAPTTFYTDPLLPGPTRLTVTDDGYVFGHVDRAGVCLRGVPGCDVAEPSPSGYAQFLTSQQQLDDGTVIPVGVLTVRGGHDNDLFHNASQARAHYDDMTTAWATVTAGHDQWGTWVSGRVLPHVTSETLSLARTGAPSGDWRPINGALDLIGVHVVVTPGYPVESRVAAFDADGNVSGVLDFSAPGTVNVDDPMAVLRGELAALRGQVAEMRYREAAVRMGHRPVRVHSGSVGPSRNGHQP